MGESVDAARAALSCRSLPVLGLATVLCALPGATGCISRQVVIPGMEFRDHVSDLLRNGSAAAKDRGGRDVTLSTGDAEVREALAGCQTPGQWGFTGKATACRLKDTDELSVERVDIGASVGLWTGALLATVVAGVVVGVVVDASRSGQPAPAK
jgi:hypothetical protein